MPLLPLLLLVACADKGGTAATDSGGPGGDDGPPLDMPLLEDGVTYAGAAIVDVTPEIVETWTDVNGNDLFEGCLWDPDGSECKGEPFDDVNGNGWFDAVWIGGFSPLRPADSVHDPVYARATVIAKDGEYVAFVALDFVGLGSPRIHEARDRLVATEGFDPDRLIVSSSHNHQGPDTMGLWGNPFNLADPVSGIDPEYQAAIPDAIEQAVRDAAAAMEPVDLTIGTVRMRDRSRWFNGSDWGGDNPVAKMHGMIYDGRDPVLVSDQLLVLQGNRPDGSGTVFTLTNWSGHPETWGGDNNSISSDWIGVTRQVLEARYGGVAMHLPESLGGMQSALNGDLPLVEEDGTHVFQTCSAEEVADEADGGCFGKTEGDARTTDDGEPLPAWAERDTWEFVRSHGWHIAEAAIAALDAGQPLDPSPIRVEAEGFYLPITNIAYQLLGPMDVFDLGLDDAVFDEDLCPWVDDTETPGGEDMGCIETRTFRLQLGDLGLVAVPGELLPELAWGLPEDDPAWQAEVADLTARGSGRGAIYFPQHPEACDSIAYEDCRERMSLDGCDCTRMHASPYRLSYDETQAPLLDAFDLPHEAVVGMADNYLSYIVPEPDFNKEVSLLSDDGDHYEDTVSPTWVFATELQKAQGRIDDRW
ncbi:MAG: neutral/alkaline non-lysosomal ceramidase N-terminal domain-containing protein [Alphaproteobacteria bacterium]|nr:neutral/alkaline non-lysosomal ceramidase N-terminal domain-containing protein [Alphaproteobacteria bacterium]